MNDDIRIWAFGDTHGNERQLEVPDNIDIAIFSGDAGTYRDPYRGEPIIRDFIDWFYGLDIKHKVMIAGNHDSPIETGLFKEPYFVDRGIEYLYNEPTVIEGLKIWGSPYTPTFGSWSFMKSRNKIHKVWDLIPDDTDILVTHGPPQGILDIAPDYQKVYEFCGCANLYKQVTQRIKPKYHMFGHIHDARKEPFKNSGIREIPNCRTIFSNGSVCTNGKMDKVTSNGNVLNYKRD